MKKVSPGKSFIKSKTSGVPRTVSTSGTATSHFHLYLLYICLHTEHGYFELNVFVRNSTGIKRLRTGLRVTGSLTFPLLRSSGSFTTPLLPPLVPLLPRQKDLFRLFTDRSTSKFPSVFSSITTMTSRTCGIVQKGVTDILVSIIKVICLLVQLQVSVIESTGPLSYSLILSVLKSSLERSEYETFHPPTLNPRVSLPHCTRVKSFLCLNRNLYCLRG